MNELDSIINCSICSNEMCDPTTMHCGHSFCRSCTIKWCLKYKHYNCPTCRKAMDKTLPNVNVTLKTLIYFLKKTKTAEPRKDNSENVPLRSISSLPMFDHDYLMKKISNDLNKDQEEGGCKYNKNKSNQDSDFGSEKNLKNDSSLKRLSFIYFPLYLVFALFGIFF